MLLIEVIKLGSDLVLLNDYLWVNAVSENIINIIQDIATPHNNVLIEGFVTRKNVVVNVWYAQNHDNDLYQWSSDISHQHKKAIIYNTKINLSFLSYCLSHVNEKYVIVGWMNINTKLLTFIFFLLRRPFNHWTDLPYVDSGGAISKLKKIQLWFAYKILRYSNCKVFCVGIKAVESFKKRGFPDHMLVNMPIFVAIDGGMRREKNLSLLSQYKFYQDDVVITAGSRLLYDKGYDLLIESVSQLPINVRNKIKVIIVGSGEEFQNLKNQIDFLDLNNCVFIEKWMDIADFKKLIHNSHMFVHPARFDSYGGTVLAMSLGVPVIGSTGAGAAVDRIKHGINGFLYDAEDIKSLANYIVKLSESSVLRNKMGKEARKTAQEWPPSRGVNILVEYSI